MVRSWLRTEPVGPLPLLGAAGAFAVASALSPSSASGSASTTAFTVASTVAVSLASAGGTLEMAKLHVLIWE